MSKNVTFRWLFMLIAGFGLGQSLYSGSQGGGVELAHAIINGIVEDIKQGIDTATQDIFSAPNEGLQSNLLFLSGLLSSNADELSQAYDSAFKTFYALQKPVYGKLLQVRMELTRIGVRALKAGRLTKSAKSALRGLRESVDRLLTLTTGQ